MIKRVLVIADDLTGAAEIGGIAHRYGLATTLLRAPVSGGVGDGATIIDTDSRDLPEKQAAARVREAVARVGHAFDLIYKKTDSVLRGPVRAEIEAALDALGLQAALLLPQNPSRGRTIRGGRYFINGVPLEQTEFARDPSHPVRTSRVSEIVRSARIRIGDAETAGDVRAWAGQVKPDVLWAGGADFFEAILGEHGLVSQSAPPPLPPIGAAALFVCGSASANRQRLIERATAAHIPLLCVSGSQTVDVGPRAVLVLPQELDAQPGASARLLEALADAVGQALRQGRFARIYLEGGATAAAVCRRMGWDRFAVEAELATGIVQLRLDQGALSVVVKPGSYEWPSSVFA